MPRRWPRDPRGAPIDAPPEPEPEPSPRERPTAEPEPRAAPEPEPSADAPEPSRLTPTALAPEESRADAEDGDAAHTHAGGEPRSPGTSDKHGAGSDGHRGGGTFDGSSYGKEIVRIVLEEIDDNPVPGLKRTDAIQVLLHVKPDGSLAWRGSGRFGFARVLASTVGRIRTRAILKRIERASWRFPAHPAGLKPRRHYVVDMTVRFSRGLVRD